MKFQAFSLLPDLFRRKISKDEFAVAFEVLKTYSSVSIQKKFFIKEFLACSRISNHHINTMKRTFIQLVKLFEAVLMVKFIRPILDSFIHLAI